MIVTAGKTNVSVYFYVTGDASHASPGDPITGLLFSDFETGGSASYMRQGAARVDFTLQTLASASAAHVDGGFILVDDTNMPGVYRCDVPDAAFSTGADQIVVHLVAASANNATIAPLLIDISDVDLRDATRAGLTDLNLATLSQGKPSASPTLGAAIMHLYWTDIYSKQIVDTSAVNQRQIFADDGSTVLFENDITDAANIFTRSEVQSGA